MRGFPSLLRMVWFGMVRNSWGVGIWLFVGWYCCMGYGIRIIFNGRIFTHMLGEEWLCGCWLSSSVVVLQFGSSGLSITLSAREEG